MCRTSRPSTQSDIAESTASTPSSNQSSRPRVGRVGCGGFSASIGCGTAVAGALADPTGAATLVALRRSAGVPGKVLTASARDRHEVVELVGPCLRGPGPLLHQWSHRWHEAVVEEGVPGLLGLP